MPGQEVTRSGLQRALLINAATKPLHIAVAAVVAIAGILLGAPWLIAVAAVAYVVLGAFMFFDGDEAERVGKELYGERRARAAPQLDVRTLAPPIAAHVSAARAEDQRIRQAVADAEGPFEDVARETDSLMVAMEGIAQRAQRVYAYLATQDQPRIERRLAELRAQGDRAPADLVTALDEQVAALGRLRVQLDRFYTAMEHMTASLGTVHAQLVSMSVAGDDAAQAQLAGEVRDLREQVNAVSEGMREAYAQAPDPPAA